MSLDLTAIKQRLHDAQVGDWPALIKRHGARWFAGHLIVNSTATREFVAHSRTDVAALVGEVERLRRAVHEAPPTLRRYSGERAWRWHCAACDQVGDTAHAERLDVMEDWRHHGGTCCCEESGATASAATPAEGAAKRERPSDQGATEGHDTAGRLDGRPATPAEVAPSEAEQSAGNSAGLIQRARCHFGRHDFKPITTPKPHFYDYPIGIPTEWRYRWMERCRACGWRTEHIGELVPLEDLPPSGVPGASHPIGPRPPANDSKGAA